MNIASSICGSGNGTGIFWDSNLTLNAGNPDLPTCFENTALLWSISGLLSISVLIYLPFLAPLETVNGFANKGLQHWLKTMKIAILFCVSIGKFVVVYSKSPSNRTLDLEIEPFIRLISSLMIFLMIEYEFCKGNHTSGILSVFLLLFTSLSVIVLRSTILQELGRDFIILNSIELFGYSMLLLNFFFSDKNAIHWLRKERSRSVIVNERTPLLAESNISQQDEEINLSKKPPCPESTCSFFSNIIHLWMLPLIIKGFRKYLNFEDLFDLPEKEKCSSIVPNFLQLFEETYQKSEKKKPIKDQIEGCKRPIAVFIMLLKACKGPFILSAICRVLYLVPDIGVSLLLKVLLQYLKSSHEYHAWHGYLIAIVMSLDMIALSILLQLQYKFSYTTAQRMRSIVVSAVFRKSLRLSSASRSKSTSGEINNLMSVDAEQIHEMMLNFNEFWASPLTVIVTLYFMWQVIGPSCLAGFGFLIVMAPFTGGFLAAQYAKTEVKQMALKDMRLKHINEILSGMKMIKYYAWEKVFAKKVEKVRNDEIKTIRTQAFYNMGLGLVWYSAPFCVAFVIFTTYILSSKDHVLDAEKTFVTLSFVNLLNFCLSFLPMLLGFSAQAYVSLGRIYKLLSQEELDPITVQNDTGDHQTEIVIENGTFTWGNPESQPTLSDINISVKTGELVAVVGRVGSGKSSLISSLLGEMRIQKGTIKVGGSTAYLSQQAWIQNATLKDNILFVSSFNRARYNRVIEACALSQDLEQLPAGDKTEIGEKGINLSGGQKQRVALARAIYSKANIFVLDDPLSAVDAHVGQKIFDEVLGPSGILKRKTRILVTHAVNILPECDRIIMLKNGKINGDGTYSELLRSCPEFATLLKKSKLNGNDESDESGESSEGKSNSKEELSDEAASIMRRRVSRQKSISFSENEKKLKSSFSVNEKSDLREQGRLIEDEREDIGTVKAKVIFSYIKAGSLKLLFCLIILMVFYIAIVVTTNWWLSYWSDMSQNITRSSSLKMLGVYAGLGVGQVLFVALSQACSLLGAVLASKVLHENLFKRILRAPMTFFDTTPLGRILNRFSLDMEKVDASLPDLSTFWLGCLATMLSTLIGITLATPQFLISAVPLATIYFLTQRMYIKSIRQLKRIDSVRKSPIYACFDEVLAGVSIIRAFKVTPKFIYKNDTLVNNSMTAWYPILVGQRWLGLTLDSIGAIAIFFAAFFAVYLRDSGYLTPGLAGMSLNFAIETSYALSMIVRSSADLETNIVSVERIQEYTETDQEADWRVPDRDPDPNTWPRSGIIDLESVCVRYRQNLPLVLNNINLKINQREKIGIVGRTGAGKSSLASVLFRVIELSSGKILIDNVDISAIGLHALREKITIIPQDPIMFDGSLRDNLDPHEKFTDDEIWQSLEMSHLKDHVKENLDDGLEHECGEGGISLSVGQRQLVCLARALLRNSKILVMDEATASIDANTDSLIQQTIRKAFADSTIITIAHRLVTIMDYDRIVVLDSGQVVEEGSPSELLTKFEGKFRRLAEEAGLAS